MTAPVFDRLAALADPIRGRMLLVLEPQELTVGELGTVLQLPQSTVSRHLRVLARERWVSARAEGTARWYRMTAGALGPAGRRLWRAVREQLVAVPITAHDAQRLRGVLSRRRERASEFFATTAGEWDRVRAELFGADVDRSAILSLLDDRWVVTDLGCGTGQLAAALAPFVRQVIGVDESRAMLAAARRRVAGVTNVELRRGALEELPISDVAADAALLVLALPYVTEPPRVLAEARRVLRPRGRVVVVDMLPHDRAEYRQRMGHAWQGFSERQLGRWFATAGFEGYRYQPLAASPEAAGPALFAASARATAASAMAGLQAIVR